MRIHVGQIYIEADVNYPFSHYFQRFVSEELTKRIAPSESFVRKYAEDYELIFNMSAKAALVEPEVRGPTVFRKDKDVEYTIFLPFDKNEPQGPDTYRRALRLLIDSIFSVLKSLQMDVSQLSQDSDEIIERIMSDPKMINA